MAKRKNSIGNYSKTRLDKIIRQNSAAAGSGITTVTAGNGLSGGGSDSTVTLRVDIASTTDGSGVTIAADDQILLADTNDSNNVKRVQISQLPDTPAAGSTAQLQYNNNGAFGASANLTFASSTLSVNGTAASKVLSGSTNLSITGSAEFTGSLGINVKGASITHGITLPNETSDNSGMIKATAYLTYSSARFKTNIETIQEPLEKLDSLRGVTFEWKGSGKKDMGFIVEEVERVLPEMIGYDGQTASSLDYAKMTSFLLQCVKNQQEILKHQQEEIENLKSLITK